MINVSVIGEFKIKQLTNTDVIYAMIAMIAMMEVIMIVLDIKI